MPSLPATRDEPGREGMAHFCANTSRSKATKRRGAWHILNYLEGVGGDLNAFTTKEDTVYHAAVLKDNIDRAVDLLTDIVFHSTYPQTEIDKEVEVICDDRELQRLAIGTYLRPLRERHIPRSSARTQHPRTGGTAAHLHHSRCNGLHTPTLPSAERRLLRLRAMWISTDSQDCWRKHTPANRLPKLSQKECISGKPAKGHRCRNTYRNRRSTQWTHTWRM